MKTAISKYDVRHIVCYGQGLATHTSRHEATHDRIVELAARTLRRNGYAGVGVAEVNARGKAMLAAARDALLAQHDMT